MVAQRQKQEQDGGDHTRVRPDASAAHGIPGLSPAGAARQALMFTRGIAVGHAGDEVGHHPRRSCGVAAALDNSPNDGFISCGQAR